MRSPWTAKAEEILEAFETIPEKERPAQLELAQTMALVGLVRAVEQLALEWGRRPP